jgi:cytochrome P450
MHNLHVQYGPVVRYAPDMLSYIDQRAWKDIHGFKKPSPAKVREAYGVPPNKTPNMLGAFDDDVHARMRRIFAHAFSDKALKEQEPLFLKYINMLVGKLNETLKVNPEAKIDMVRMLSMKTTPRQVITDTNSMCRLHHV